MVEQTKFKIRIEIGPGVGDELSPFLQPSAYVALLTAALRAMTAEQLYLGTEFTGTKDGVTAVAIIDEAKQGGDDNIPWTIHSQMEGTVRIELPDAKP
jgi:hypothetical protein